MDEMKQMIESRFNHIRIETKAVQCMHVTHKSSLGFVIYCFLVEELAEKNFSI